MEDKYSYILNIAENDSNIRGVILYGSRADDDVKPDEYQDYDIYFIVTNKEDFDVSVFENVKLKFIPSENYPELFPEEHVYLMLFEDDNRIDLSVCTLNTFYANHYNGLLMKCLLDKDNYFKDSSSKDNSEINRHTNLTKPLDEMLNLRTCSEFFYRKKYLTQAEYALYKNTYISNTIEDMWKSAFCMIDLFGDFGRQIADKYQYQYPSEDEQYMRNYLYRIMLK